MPGGLTLGSAPDLSFFFKPTYLIRNEPIILLVLITTKAIMKNIFKKFCLLWIVKSIFVLSGSKISSA